MSGQEAKEVIGRTPGSIVAVRPLKDGVIADFDITASMLQIFIKKVLQQLVLARPRVVICIPSGVTEVERRAVRGGGLQGGRQAGVDHRGADGRGHRRGPARGGGHRQHGGGHRRRHQRGGGHLAGRHRGGPFGARGRRRVGRLRSSSISSSKYNLLIGERTAEDIKISIGSAYPLRGGGQRWRSRAAT